MEADGASADGEVRQLSRLDRVLVLGITTVAFIVIFRPTIAELNLWRGLTVF